MMKTIAVHPMAMKKIQAGGIVKVMTRYEVEAGEEVEIVTDDEVVSVVTRIRSVRKIAGVLNEVELDDPAERRRDVEG